MVALANTLAFLVVFHYGEWQQQQRVKIPGQQKIKTILFWNGVKRSELTVFGTGHDAFIQHGCPVSDCEIVNSPHQYPDRPLESYDAILLNFNDEFWMNKRPHFQRRPKQRFVFFTQEPPPSIEPMNITEYDNYFNWTMTYRMDSDVRLLYGRIRPKPSAPKTAQEIEEKIKETHSKILYKKNKKKKKKRKSYVAAMISHCKTDGRREDYIKQLRKYIKVDVYGYCNEDGPYHLKCDTDELLSSTPECYDMLQSNYKFYLSFENSICPDYVTEKFFHIMSHEMVPVVYGGGDYSSIAPVHSYIDALKYKPKELAEYLLVLAKNETLYGEYFWWKEDYVVEAGLAKMVGQSFCELCRKLHEDDGVYQSYPSLMSRWDSANCRVPKFKKTRKPTTSSPINMMDYLFHRP